MSCNVKQLETVPEIKILNFIENIFPVWFQAAVVWSPDADFTETSVRLFNIKLFFDLRSIEFRQVHQYLLAVTIKRLYTAIIDYIFDIVLNTS